MSAAAASVTDPTSELAVACRLHQLVVAIPARWVSRLVLPHEVRNLREPVDEPAGLPAVVECAGVAHAAWDLGLLLGEPEVSGAWFLMRIPHRGKILALALRTGECLAVAATPKAFELPPRAFERRPLAIGRAFTGQLARGGGLILDVSHLWTEAELDASVRALKVAP